MARESVVFHMLPSSYSTQLWKMAHLYCRWLTYRKWWSSMVFNGFHGFSIAMLTSHCRLPEGNLAPGLCSPCRSLRKHQRHDAVATSRRNAGNCKFCFFPKWPLVGEVHYDLSRFNGSSSVLMKIRKKTWVRNPKINMESNVCIVMVHYGVHEAPNKCGLCLLVHF